MSLSVFLTRRHLVVSSRRRGPFRCPCRCFLPGDISLSPPVGGAPSGVPDRVCFPATSRRLLPQSGPLPQRGRPLGGPFGGIGSKILFCLTSPIPCPMSFCLSCAEWARESPLCRRCAADLAPGPQWRLPSGLIVSAGLRHTGAARRLVHRLKYQGLTEAAGVLADFMVGRMPAAAAALAPVPRARVRRLRYGIDPAEELARALARRSGLPIVTPLRAPLWWGRQAARARPPQRAAVRGRNPTSDACCSRRRRGHHRSDAHGRGGSARF